jgi:hypothetical protein
VRTYEGCQFYTYKTNLPAHEILATVPAQPGPRRSGQVARRDSATPAPDARRRLQTRAAQRGMSMTRRHAPGAATSRSHPPASPAPQARARGLARIAPSIVPPGGIITISRGPRRHMVIGRPATRTSLLAPLGRGVGGPMLAGRHRHLFLMWPCGRGRNTQRLARRRLARCCPRHPL